MYVLGIVGGVASGKSAVAKVLANHGAQVIDADAVGHLVLREPDVIAALRARWGDAVVGPDGQIIRREVARRVFGTDQQASRERQFLNSVTHPQIQSHLSNRIQELRSAGHKLAVLDAALLYETGWDQLCDGVLLVDVPRELRLARALGRGWSAEQFTARETSQWPVEEKKVRAKWIVDNSGTLVQLEQQLTKVLAAIGVTSSSPGAPYDDGAAGSTS